MAKRHLRNDKDADADARQRSDDPADVRSLRSEPSWLLSELAKKGPETGRGGLARRDPEGGAQQTSSWWLSADHAGPEERRLAHQSQACVAIDARRQPAEYSSPSIRGDHR